MRNAQFLKVNLLVLQGWTLENVELLGFFAAGMRRAKTDNDYENKNHYFALCGNREFISRRL